MTTKELIAAIRENAQHARLVNRDYTAQVENDAADRLEAIVKAWDRVPSNPSPAAFEALRAAILGD